jgi:hydrogenase maturation protein HypF
MNDQITGLKIWVRGIVQGVGFRPFVFNLAERLELKGWVKNTSSGVEIEACGTEEALQRFVETIRDNPPPLARIDDLRAEPAPVNGYTDFKIYDSQPQEGAFIPVSPDVAICDDCRRELFDPANRRFRYPFINCTNCGPRFSIIRDIPYDRPNTTMSGFALCPDCQREYEDPHDRRFHAQPVACPTCGPKVWFEEGQGDGETGGPGDVESGEKALQKAREWLKAGKILAVKGLGGFHLACDAGNAEAVAELRRRKKRSDKPFALMAFDLEIVKKHCLVSDEEAALLTSHQAPVVLLERRPASTVAEEAAPAFSGRNWNRGTLGGPEYDSAPCQVTLGFMLPYTPLHLLLLEPAPGFPEVLVMTSGNLSEEPIAYRDEEARQRLNDLADGFLLHDRPIHMRVDDSVARMVQGSRTVIGTPEGPAVPNTPAERGRGQVYLVRRARGFAPDPLLLPETVPPMLATGAELKNTFGLARDRYAFLSHHIGDMENFETLRSFEEGITHFERLFRVKPQLVACDLHPNYLATRYAQQRAKQENLPLVTVQHHHAHLAACLADNDWTSSEPVIGLSFDGTGYGTDGTIWGGEVLVGGYHDYVRRYHLAYVPLPGGDQAVRKPSRMALSHLWSARIDWEPDLPPACDQGLCAEERTVLKAQLERRINAPLTSSMGRLFDAASALIGIRQKATYEGQAAIELEAAAHAAPEQTGYYPFEVRGEIIDPRPLWLALLADWRAGAPLPTLAARFHNSIVHLAVELCQAIRVEYGIKTVALSGGVWQNLFLLEHSISDLEQAGFRVLTHHQVPPNDGCIALGQMLVASHKITNSE